MLLYGSLLEAAPFLINDERIPVWQMFFDEGVLTLKEEQKNAEHSQGSLRVRVA